MTVKELREELLKYPEDAKVKLFYFSSDEDGEEYNNYETVQSLELVDGYVVLYGY